jgi:hypothetical protein
MPRRTESTARGPIPLGDLWISRDAEAWAGALARYWDFVLPRNIDLERRFEHLDLAAYIGPLDEKKWYEFLRDEYFRWKYTAPNRYATTTRTLRRYEDESRLPELNSIKERLLALDPTDIGYGLLVAGEIMGLGTAGASSVPDIGLDTARHR